MTKRERQRKKMKKMKKTEDKTMEKKLDKEVEKKENIINKSVSHECIIIVYTHFQWLLLKGMLLNCHKSEVCM